MRKAHPHEGWLSIHQDANRDGTGRFLWWVSGGLDATRSGTESYSNTPAPFPRDLPPVFYWLGCLGARHSLTAPSWLPDARIMPSGENATACTGARCPFKVSSS